MPILSAALAVAVSLTNLLSAPVSVPAKWKPEYADASSKIKEWFENQTSLEGGWCCNIADGHREGKDGFTDWGRDPATGLFYVIVDGNRHVVPKAAVTDYEHDPSPTGEAVVWFRYGTVDGNGHHSRYIDGVRCFTPGVRA